MSFAVSELSRLLSKESTVLGAVTKIAADGSVTVATQKGAITVQADAALKVGERVIISNGRAQSAPNASGVYPV